MLKQLNLVLMKSHYNYYSRIYSYTRTKYESLYDLGCCWTCIKFPSYDIFKRYLKFLMTNLDA